MKRIYKDFLSTFMWVSIWAMMLLPHPESVYVILLTGILVFLLYLVALDKKDGTGWGGH